VLALPLTVLAIAVGLALVLYTAPSLLLLFAGILFATLLDACTRGLGYMLPMIYLTYSIFKGATAPANPWIFRQIEQYCAAVESGASLRLADEGVRPTTGSGYDEPSEADRYEMIRTYFRMLIEEELPDATGKMKQFGSWFTHGVPGGAGLRKAIYESKSAPEILSRVEEFFEARLAAVSVGRNLSRSLRASTTSFCSVAGSAIECMRSKGWGR
jgi:hypothetical protein